MPSLSVCMIVKDEEPVIRRCLSIVTQFADETIVIDTGSKDRTKEIAEEFTDQVFEYLWEDDFAKARNISYSKATCDYIMWMDADDVIQPEGIERLRELMHSLDERIDVVFLPYTEHNKGEPEVFDSYLMRDRIIRRSLDPVWENPIHEAIPIKKNWNKKLCHDIPVYHEKLVVNEKERNMRIFEKSLSEGWKLSDYSKSFYCRELSTSERYEQAVDIFYGLFHSRADDSIVNYALFFYIHCMEKLKRYRELRGLLLQYVKQYQETELVCCELGRCYLKENNLREAEYWYQKAMVIEVDDSDMKVHCPAWTTAIPLVQISKIYLKQCRLDEAQDYLDRVKSLAGDWKMVKVIQLILDYQRKKYMDIK